ncbi:MAG: hypothetical protein D6734_11720, partial [Candidatus Schekmanbacteria bacterium]
MGGDPLKVYEITIKPKGRFGTPLKGDTLFGHFCWQIAYDDSLIGIKIKEFLESYSSSPLVIFSSAFPKFVNHEGDNDYEEYALKKPDVPIKYLSDFSKDENNETDKIDKRKEFKKKK